MPDDDETMTPEQEEAYRLWLEEMAAGA